MTLTVGSLFSGIGGFDLGLERAGMKVIWQSEIDEFASRVLKKHWPDVPNLGDITKVDWSKVERPDVICGGYPCQPFSTAGKRGGATDPRHLWPAMFNAICLLRPRYALMENVRGHLSMGFGDVLADLASIGFDAEWQVIPAASVGAPHKRDRVFIVAYPNCSRRDGNGQPSRQKKTQPRFASSSSHLSRHDRQNNKKMANTNSEQLGQPGRTKDIGSKNRVWSDNGRRETTNGFRQWWEVEPNVGRVANGIPDRVDRLKGLGNAIVPQVAEFVGALVVEHSQN
jgi:DNA (cytosine-5)-methyltransferase 1